MSHFSWPRASYVLFGFAVFAALIKLWSPGVSISESLAGEKRPNGETPRLLSQAGESNTQTRKLPTPKISTPRQESFVRHKLDIPNGTNVTGEKETPKRQEPAERTNEPPVFYRPAPEASGDDLSSEAGPVCGDLGNFPKSSRAVFPLQNDYFYAYDDTWGAPRPQGGHEGTDLMTPSGVPEYAITDGTVVPVSGSNEDGWNTLGGYTVMVRADYDIGPVREGDLFYYAHMNEKSTLPAGAKVQAGQVLGYSGDTGQGPEVTRGLFPPHLHLGWYDGGGDRSDLDSGAMDPYPLLEWIKRNGGSVVGGSDARYCEEPRPADAPSAETERWSATSPGKSPDLDTGTEDPLPSPIVRKRPTISHTAVGRRKARANLIAAQWRKNPRTIPQKASALGKNVPANGREPSVSPESERRADQPAPPSRHRVSREPPKRAVNRGARRPAETTKEVPEKQRDAEQRDAETPPKKANNERGTGTERSERPEKPELSEERGCGTGCPAEPDDSRTSGEQPETTTPEPETTPPEDGVEVDPVKAGGPSGGEDEVTGGKTGDVR